MIVHLPVPSWPHNNVTGSSGLRISSLSTPATSPRTMRDLCVSFVNWVIGTSESIDPNPAFLYVPRLIRVYISSPFSTADRTSHVQTFLVFRLSCPPAMPLPPQSRLTIILVNNLHCPSCTTNVEETLSALQPPPFSISTSIM